MFKLLIYLPTSITKFWFHNFRIFAYLSPQSYLRRYSVFLDSWVTVKHFCKINLKGFSAFLAGCRWRVHGFPSTGAPPSPSRFSHHTSWRWRWTRWNYIETATLWTTTLTRRWARGRITTSPTAQRDWSATTYRWSRNHRVNGTENKLFIFVEFLLLNYIFLDFFD